jgi:hypothetical protein
MDNFFQLYDQFTDYLTEICPEIVMYIEIIDEIKKRDRRLVYDMFLSTLAPYSSQIFAKDEDFFVNEMPVSENQVIESLKQKMSQLNDDQKQIIWFFLHNMLLEAANDNDTTMNVERQNKFLQFFK